MGHTMDSNKCTSLVLIDQSAAFDTVNQDAFLHRLQAQFGVTKHVLKWFSSYLKGRTQVVRVQGCDSEIKPLRTVFPQGSIETRNDFTTTQVNKTGPLLRSQET